MKVRRYAGAEVCRYADEWTGGWVGGWTAGGRGGGVGRRGLDGWVAESLVLTTCLVFTHQVPSSFHEKKIVEILSRSCYTMRM